MSGISLVNRELKAADVGLKLVRGRGYYYLVDTVEDHPHRYSDGIYVYKLEPEDLVFALGEVISLLKTPYNLGDWTSQIAAIQTRINLLKKGGGK